MTVSAPASGDFIAGLDIDAASFGNMANAATSHYVRLRDLGAGTTKLIVKGDGKVGIGTANPQATLTVSTPGSSDFIAALDINVASFGNMANAATSRFLRVGSFPFSTTLIVKGDGTVGIGTEVTSNATLTVAGSILATGGNVIASSFFGNGSELTGVAAATLRIPPGMALIPAGPFTMGDTLDGMIDETPVTTTVSAFYMDVNLVSYSQWLSVYLWATNHGYGFVHPGAGKAANHPVQTVDWYDAVKWCNARSEQAGLTPVYYTDAGLTVPYRTGEVAVYANWTAKGYRLPTEAEWEKAARGGLSGQRFPWGNVITENLANYYGNTLFTYDAGPNGYNAAFTNGATPYTSPAGYFAPNAYGLYDMAGNAFAWCWDLYGTPYAGGTDPRGAVSGTFRVMRGGSWLSNAPLVRCADRDVDGPANAGSLGGFRCARGL